MTLNSVIFYVCKLSKNDYRVKNINRYPSFRLVTQQTFFLTHSLALAMLQAFREF